MTSPTDGGAAGGHLSPDRLRDVLAGICEACALDGAGARLIKFTNSAVFDLPRAGVVVKVAGSRLVTERIPKVIEVARWLEEHDFPAVRLLADVDQPVQASGRAATLWQRVPGDGPEPTGRDLARLIRRFHSLPPPAGLPTWDPMRGIRQRLAEADGVGAEELAFLTGRAGAVEAELAGIVPALRSGPIHGDVFLGNLIPDERGPVLCDFDSTSIGPREWDLTPVAVGSLRFDYEIDPHASFAAAYGFDVMAWDGFPVLRQLRELQLVTSVLPVLRSNPAVRGQFEHRLASLHTGDTGRWQPYARAFTAS
jgi:Ser/Thr protein kinase RdoA (MazF antagonist)